MANEKRIVIKGQLIDQNQRPLAGLRVEAWDKDHLTSDDFLGEEISGQDGHFQIAFGPERFKEGFFDSDPDIFFRIFRGEDLIHSTEDSVLWNFKHESYDLTITIEIKDESGGSEGKRLTVEGRVVNSNGVPLSGYFVEVYLKSLEKDFLAGKTVSGEKGAFSISFSPSGLKSLPDIEARAYAKGDEENFTRSEIKFNAAEHVSVDVIVPVDKVKAAPEFERVLKTFGAHLGGMEMADLKENEETKQISFLSKKTGYDARIVAMIASAHRIWKSLGISPAHVYALHRAGIPGKEEAVIATPPEKVEEILTKAAENNIIPAGSNIKETIGKLADRSVDLVLHGKNGTAVSTMADMLNLRLNEEQKKLFAETFKQTGTDPDVFWDRLEENGIAKETIGKLQLDGKLGFLTGQNAPLIKKIQSEFSIGDDTDLVSNGLYKASEWEKLLSKDDIPQGVDADLYASHLANKVRLSYPNLVAAHMIGTNEVKIGDNVPKRELNGFFSKNHTVNSIGVQPVSQWEGYGDLSAPAKVSVRTFERLYQMTPSDASMIALSTTGVSSAYEMAALTKNEFVNAHGKTFPSIEEAEKTYDKGGEILVASLILATGYLTERSRPNLYGLTGSTDKPKVDAIAYPTLEVLLGNMDYCACDHCKSVLSPAAYLVELLRFIDLAAGSHSGDNPIEVLKRRRPDIENIQLSCENTNMELPYIDLVNEILEHYILHSNLNALEGHDVAEGASQADLLAEPSFVEKTVYETNLVREVFPYNLPFHQPLETLRKLFNMWDGVSLEKCLAVFSAPLASRKEAIDCNEEEYKTLTDRNFKELPQYFGEAAGTTLDQLDAAISNGKEFSRRVGISYEQLVKLLKTNFINPGAVLTPALQSLKISLADLQSFYDGDIADEKLDAKIPAEIDQAKYGGDVKKWLKENRHLIMGLIVLTDIGDGRGECDFAQVALRFALPDNNANKLTEAAYHKFHRFLRLMKKTGWSMDTLDAVIKPLLTIAPDLITVGNIDTTFKVLFDRIANFKKLAERLSLSEKKYAELLSILDPSSAVSLRREQLAKILKISIPELIQLSEISGIDPLADDFEADRPSLTGFIALAKNLKANGLKIVDLAYILRHRDDAGDLVPGDAVLSGHIRLLKNALNAVEKETSTPPAAMGFDYAKSKMLLVYDAVSTDRFFGLLLETNVYKHPLATDESALPAPLAAADPRLEFNSFKKVLIYNGILTAPQKTLLKDSADALVLADLRPDADAAALTAFKTGFNTALEQILTEAEKDLGDFGAALPKLKEIYDAAKTKGDEAAQSQEIVDRILPALKRRLKINALEQQLAGITKADPKMVNAVSDRKDVLHAESDDTRSLADDLMQLENKSVFDQVKTYEFYFDVPVTDEYILYLSGSQGTRITLSIDGTILINDKTIGASKEENTGAPVLFKAGELHSASLTIAALPSDKITLSWRTNGMTRSEVPDSALYDGDRVNLAKLSLIRTTKALQLAGIFKLTPPELEYFAAVNTETKDFLNEIPAAAGISDPAMIALWSRVDLLISFQNLKKANEPAENTWLSVLLNPELKNAQNKLLLESFNNWREEDVTEVLTRLVINRADLSKISKLRKVTEAMGLVTAIGHPAAKSLGWITNAPSYDEVAAAKSAIKQAVTEAAWLESIQTVSDAVRNLLRDALVAYILQYKRPKDVDTPNKLYEHFLIDVEMDACMKTSRIRMALSTVQLFIQRCLMSLEPDVEPSSIRAEQWAWMKRYRVWEANRKVFLYPENWLEPELRDNKSSMFREFEGELMQQEITDESAELAFLNYLKKLDDIAKLEIVGMYLEEKESRNKADDTLHVIGRTNGNTRQYYYRRYELGSWTPWEKISLNIEGEHIFPVVWKKRLFLFWLTVIEKARSGDTTTTPAEVAGVSTNTNVSKNIEISICWGEYYKGKWTSPKSTDLNRSLTLFDIPDFDRRYLQINARKDIVENPAGKFRENLIFDISYGVLQFSPGYAVVEGYGGTFKFTSKNAPPNVIDYHDPELFGKVIKPTIDEFSTVPPQYYFNRFIKTYGRDFKVNVPQPAGALQSVVNEKVFTKGTKLTEGFDLLTLHHPVENQFEAPISYSDEHSTFFIEPVETVFIPIWDHGIYYTPPEIFEPVFETPLIIEQPVPDWRGEMFVNPALGVLTGDPWTELTGKFSVAEGLGVLISDTATFAFGDLIFNSGGTITPADQFSIEL